MNFIGRVLKTRAAQDRPTDEDRERAAAAFPALLADLNSLPYACLVLDDPKGRLWHLAEPLLAAGPKPIKAVRLAHPTMIKKGGGTPTREERKAAWQAVCAAAQLHRSP